MSRGTSKIQAKTDGEEANEWIEKRFAFPSCYKQKGDCLVLTFCGELSRKLIRSSTLLGFSYHQSQRRRRLPGVEIRTYIHKSQPLGANGQHDTAPRTLELLVASSAVNLEEPLAANVA